ncbi:alpha/beta hydrolase [Aestuariibaculum marinum]|uniref:Alpha/beta hydrolase n=1 Tax=Aestuariibaculum marinum TaxID=2683592 RepID=A0A8J6Q3P3_9FLAO|nr:alpha/beta hydrolase [Aestuariibaculum marinum]MBD0823734.1 alpha/beta hydrolase [Aestuariibaculum marinum]
MKTIIWLIIFFITSYSTSFAQKKEDYKPYAIENTFQKLKKSYPNISAITPLVSDSIIYCEDITYKKTETSKLKLDIYRPKSQNKKETFPAVLLIHGGGWLVGSKDNQRIMGQHLAQHGYVGISVSYRLGFEATYPAAVNDLKEAIIWIKKHAKKYHINPEKITVLGASAGAQLATLVGVTPNSSLYSTHSKISNEVQAIVNIDGIVSFIHPEAAAESKPGKASMAGIWLNGEKEENFKLWKEASPLEYVNSQTPPTLFINSSHARFHAGRDDMLHILNKHNIYNETHTLKESPHSFWLANPWFDTTLNYTVNFLNKVLKHENQ